MAALGSDLKNCSFFMGLRDLSCLGDNVAVTRMSGYKISTRANESVITHVN